MLLGLWVKKEKMINKKRATQKRAQATIFIIIAIVIVALAVLIYMFYPKIKSGFGFEETNPYKFMQDCLIGDVQDSVEILSNQGGSISPEHYIVYNGENIEYLCYTNEYYKTCVMQQPMLKTHVEKQIESNIKTKADECLNSLKESYTKKGYEVNSDLRSSEVELLPKRVFVNFNGSMILVKGESKKYDQFRVVLNNNLYELISIANSILNWEARYGDAETTTYMDYYKDLKLEKKKQLDGSKIYLLTDRNNENKFQFATRGIVWPPGYS